MVNTRASTAAQIPDATVHASDPLAAITARLSVLDELWDRVSVLEAQFSRREKGKTRSHWEPDSNDGPESNFRRRRPYMKLELRKFCGEDQRGWELKAEKFFMFHRGPKPSSYSHQPAPVEASFPAQEDMNQPASNGVPTQGQVATTSSLSGSTSPLAPPFLSSRQSCTTMVTTPASNATQDSNATKTAVDSLSAIAACLNAMDALSEKVAALKAKTVRRERGKAQSAVRIHKPRPVLRPSRLALESNGKAASYRGPNVNPTQHNIRPNSTYTQTYSTRDACEHDVVWARKSPSPQRCFFSHGHSNATERPKHPAAMQKGQGVMFSLWRPFSTYVTVDTKVAEEGNPVPALLVRSAMEPHIPP